MSEYKYEWITDLLKNLPEVKGERRNFIEIAGFPHREIVISNFLAFYFDENESHNFNRSFLDSLIKLINAKLKTPIDFLSKLSGDYTVEREPDFIDILIKSDQDEDENGVKDWAILIENKIHADLYNKLDKYWDSVEADNKIGVVLSLNDVTASESYKAINAGRERYVNILHGEFIEVIKESLANWFMQADDRHLLFIKDFFANMENLIEKNKPQPEMESKLEEFQSYSDQIEKLGELETELLQFVAGQLFDTMEEFGFPPYSYGKSSRTKHFLPSSNLLIKNKDEEDKGGVRFFLGINELLMKNVFHGHFELYGEFTSYGSILKKKLEDYSFINEYVRLGTGGSDKASYNHLITFDYDLSKLDQNLTLKEKISHYVKLDFFREKNGIIEIVYQELLKLIAKSKDYV